MEERFSALVVSIVILFLAAAGSAQAGSGENTQPVDTVVSEVLAVSADVSLDNNHQNGQVKEAYGHWSVLRHSENETEVLDEDTEQIYQDSDGKVSFSKNFQRSFSNSGNYSYRIEIVTASSEYDVVEEDWERYNVTSIAESRVDFQIQDGELLSFL